MILKKKGFSLLELMMVLAIASAISFLKFQELKQNQENIKADAVGQQIKQIGQAVNGYISIHYDKLSTLTNSKSESTDPGPRTCSTSTNTCTITYQTLISEGLLPSSFSGINANQSSYTILLKRSGISPNYVINGLVTTNSAWTEGSTVRYDLLGKAMQAAGIDSGMSKSTSTVSGYSGSWSEKSSDYSNINKVGVLGYRVGYDSSMYSVYLRRDGTLPMTGDLNMGSNSINNAQDITASGTTTSGTLKSTGNTNVGGNLTVAGSSTMTGALQVNNTINSSSSITAAGNVTAGNWVWAKNGYGDTIGLGGDAAANDYEIRLGSGKTLTLYSPNATQYSTVLNVNRNMVVNERLATNGLDPNNLPSGWGGGLRTYDVYGSGTIAAGDNSGNIKASINAAGYIYATGNINVDGNAYINGSINSGGDINVGKRLNAYEYVYVNGVAVSGNSCSPNGLQGRTSEGQLLSCVNGVWKSPSSLNRMTFMISGDHENYGDICQTYLNNNGLASAGWVATGSDVCTEDEKYCTVDNVRCYAIKIN